MIANKSTAPECQTEADQQEIAATLKRCTTCFELLPIGHFRFRRRRKGQRHAVCRECNRLAELDRRHRKRHRAIFSDFLSESRRKHTATALAALCVEMIHRHGGVSRLAQRWHEATIAAMGSGRTATTLRSYTVLLRLIQAAHELAPDLAELSDSDLADRKNRAIFDFVRANPTICVEIARAIGWHVVPSEAVTSDCLDKAQGVENDLA